MTKTQAGSRSALPRPFLKWAGGKRLMLPQLMERVDAAGDFGVYHEPFLGGGALFFELYRQGRLKRKARLSDLSQELMETWAMVRRDVIGVMRNLRRIQRGFREAESREHYYYDVREKRASTYPAARAARFIFLNKTCFNGLYRENRRAMFNVPYGRYKDPTILDGENLASVCDALQAKAVLKCHHFATVLDRARAGDLVYFDPPYMPVKETSFTAYTIGGFEAKGSGQHKLLADVCRHLTEMGVKVLVSNSDTPLVRELYSSIEGFVIEEVDGSRSVSAMAKGRRATRDLLIRNF